MSRILKLDQAGQPAEWLSFQDAIMCYAKNQVIWSLGEDDAGNVVTFRGGENRITGMMSTLSTAPIIAIRGEAGAAKRAHKTPSLTNDALFARDGNICAYCGKQLSSHKLSRDHIVPTSRGGPDKWTNCVTACGPCNHRKDSQLLEECGMQLIYVPYVPNQAEALVLANRNVLACQMDYLKSFLPEHSRVLERLKASTETVH